MKEQIWKMVIKHYDSHIIDRPTFPFSTSCIEREKNMILKTGK